MIRSFKAEKSPATPPLRTTAAHVVLGVAMLGAVVISSAEVSVPSLALELSESMDLQGTVPASAPTGQQH